MNNMIKYLLMWLCCLITLVTNCQELHRVDSLVLGLNSAVKNEEKLEYLHDLSWQLRGSNPDKALKYGMEAVELAKDLRLEKQRASALNNIGLIYEEQGDYMKALQFYQISLEIKQKLGDKKGIAQTLNNIGILHYYLGNDTKVMEYFLESLQIKKELGDLKGVANSYNNIGLIYDEQDDKPMALEYYFKSLMLKKRLKDKKGIANSFNNIGNLHKDQAKFNLANGYLNKALKIQEEIGDKYGMTYSLLGIGEIYSKLKEYDKAINTLERAILIAKELGNKTGLKTGYKTIAEVYKKKENFEKALLYFELYEEEKDSILNENTNNKIAELETKYQLEKKQSEIELLTKENDIQELELNKNRLLIISSLTGLILLLFLSLFIYRNNKKKHELNDLLIEQKEAITKKNEEKKVLLKEIHHRVKNNLQVINSLLRLQSSEFEDEKMVKMFEEAQHRVIAMSTLHEKMYQSDDLKHINIHDHVTLMIKELIKGYELNKEVKLDIKIEDVQLGLKTLVPLGLIINEVITNALKHAFEGKEKGVISVHLKHLENENYQLIIGDDGVGKSHEKVESSSLGSELIQIFTEQLEGTIERIEQPGTVFKIIFAKIDKL